jgi:hypothetical protein
MHVLLPATNNHAHAGHGGIEKHFARIIYDEAYEHPDRTQLSRRYKLIDLDGRLLDLTGLAVTEPAIDTHLTDELPLITQVANPVERRHVEGLPDEQVVAGRVTMDSGALSFYSLGASFHLNSPSESQRMAVRTEWTVRGVASRKSAAEGGWPVLPGLDLPSADTTRKVARLPELYPIGQSIHLMVFHAVSQEFPPHGEDFDIPEPTEDAHHFPAYYTVCRPVVTAAAAEPPIPRHAEVVDVEVDGDLVEEDGVQTPGMTCVQARAELAAISPAAGPANLAADTSAKATTRSSRRARLPLAARVV